MGEMSVGIRAVVALGLALCAAACRRDVGGGQPSAAEPVLPMPISAAAVPEGPYAGIAVSAVESTATNPYSNDPAAAKRGEALFLSMNCSGCHGQDAKTGIFAPNLTNNYWRYGSSDADVFNSIFYGRARGMPAWGAVLSKDQIWELVAYLRSLGGMTGPRLPSLASQLDTTGANAPTPANKRQP